jgi:hypothetical protein
MCSLKVRDKRTQSHVESGVTKWGKREDWYKVLKESEHESGGREETKQSSTSRGIRLGATKQGNEMRYGLSLTSEGRVLRWCRRSLSLALVEGLRGVLALRSLRNVGDGEQLVLHGSELAVDKGHRLHSQSVLRRVSLSVSVLEATLSAMSVSTTCATAIVAPLPYATASGAVAGAILTRGAAVTVAVIAPIRVVAALLVLPVPVPVSVAVPIFADFDELVIPPLRESRRHCVGTGPSTLCPHVPISFFRPLPLLFSLPLTLPLSTAVDSSPPRCLQLLLLFFQLVNSALRVLGLCY